MPSSREMSRGLLASLVPALLVAVSLGLAVSPQASAEPRTTVPPTTAPPATVPTTAPPATAPPTTAAPASATTAPAVVTPTGGDENVDTDSQKATRLLNIVVLSLVGLAVVISLAGLIFWRRTQPRRVMAAEAAELESHGAPGGAAGGDAPVAPVSWSEASPGAELVAVGAGATLSGPAASAVTPERVAATAGGSGERATRSEGLWASTGWGAEPTAPPPAVPPPSPAPVPTEIPAWPQPARETAPEVAPEAGGGPDPVPEPAPDAPRGYFDDPTAGGASN